MMRGADVFLCLPPAVAGRVSQSSRGANPYLIYCLILDVNHGFLFQMLTIRNSLFGC